MKPINKYKIEFPEIKKKSCFNNNGLTLPKFDDKHFFRVEKLKKLHVGQRVTCTWTRHAQTPLKKVKTLKPQEAMTDPVRASGNMISD